MVWNREAPGRYVREDGATIQKDRAAGVNDFSWIVWGPEGEAEPPIYEATLKDAKEAADDWWPISTVLVCESDENIVFDRIVQSSRVFVARLASSERMEANADAV